MKVKNVTICSRIREKKEEKEEEEERMNDLFLSFSLLAVISPLSAFHIQLTEERKKGGERVTHVVWLAQAV